jgi:hypothetical protein
MVAEVCVPNIGPRERRKRLYAGFVYLGVAIIALVIMMATGTSRAYRLLLFLPFWAAGTGVFQYLEKT